MLTRIAALGLVVLAAADPEWVKQVEAWRAKHEADYTRDYVPLAGLAFLKDGVNGIAAAHRTRWFFRAVSRLRQGDLSIAAGGSPSSPRPARA